MSEWISVKDRLPERRGNYFIAYVYGNSRYHFYGEAMFHPEKYAYNGYVKRPHFDNEGMDDMRVTHWMPIPKLPKED